MRRTWGAASIAMAATGPPSIRRRNPPTPTPNLRSNSCPTARSIPGAMSGRTNPPSRADIGACDPLRRPDLEGEGLRRPAMRARLAGREDSMPLIQLIAAAAALASLAAPAAAQQAYPTRPITMVVSFTAGSSIDVAGRIVAARMSELLGQSVVVENIGGAGGMTGAARVAKAAPDGYQILFGGSATHTFSQSLYKTPLYNSATEFAPVALVADTAAVLIARNDLPPNNLQELVAYMKANQ